MRRQNYPSDVTDEEWALVAPYLTLMTEDAPQRSHSLRQVFNGLRWIVRAGAPWRMMPHDLPPWQVVYQQTQRWIGAGVFETLVHDLRELLRVATGRNARPSAAIFDSRTLQSSPESGARSAYDGAKRRKGSKTHIAVDTLGHLLALIVTAASEQDRAQVAELAEAVQAATGESVEVAFVDQGYTGQQAAADAQAQKMSGTSYRVDETYIKVGKTCKYLYRAVDKEGSTIEFMLSAKRDVCAAKRFFRKMMRAEHRRLDV